MLRIKEIREQKGLTQDEVSRKSGIPKRSYVNYEQEITDIPVPKLQKIAKALNISVVDLIDLQDDLDDFPSMVNESDAIYTTKTQTIPPGSIPFYDLPVSAGQSPFDIEGSLRPDGYIKDLPGLSDTEALLPVKGYSMHPEVKEGAIIGVKKADNHDYLNTQYKYLIITNDDRMIKYIKHDLDNNDVLFCISPNYSDFRILKSEIIDIYRVTFVMNPE